MRLLLLLFFFGTSVLQLSAQDYSALSKQAWKAYEAKDFLTSATLYNQAFRENGDRGTTSDRYNAACSWALANKVDSSFYQLTRIAEKGNYTNYDHLISDSDLSSLYNDPRWEDLTAKVAENKRIAEKDFNHELVAILDEVHKTDQEGRQKIRVVEGKYGRDSEELKALWKEISYHDSVNIITVTGILDEYGWLGADIIGKSGNTTLFLVVQHSDLATQQKYLPMMREAVADGRARGGSLALLEDRVALKTGNPQIYGSQIGRTQAGDFYVQEMIDPETVDERRASVGLMPIGEYTLNWEFEWDIERHRRIVAVVKASKE